MDINFDYNKKEIDYTSGYIFKGKNYRCSYIEYDSLYSKPPKGTEKVQLYNYEPKKDIRGSVMILHGLGSRNIKFLLWLGPHLASAGVNTTILILPGNYTRVDNNSTSGKNFLYPDLDKMKIFWEQAVVDVRTTIDLLESMNRWNDNNLLLGYCLGGMISTLVGASDDRINHFLYMTTGGHLPSILHLSPAVGFVKRMFDNGFIDEKYKLHDKDYLDNIYSKLLPEIQDMTLNEILSGDFHPLLKIDPLSYAHLIDKKKVTFIDAYFDSTLPMSSRKHLYDLMDGANRKVLPISHVNWLPFGYFLAKYILHKLNFNAKEAKKALLSRETIENPLEK